MLHKIDVTDYIEVCVNRIEETIKEIESDKMNSRLFREPIAKYHTLNYETKRTLLGRTYNKLD